MALIRWVLLTMLVLVVLRLVRFTLASTSLPSARPAARRPALAVPERLVQDPVCGLLLPESRAVRDGETCYCSQECLRASRGR